MSRHSLMKKKDKTRVKRGSEEGSPTRRNNDPGADRSNRGTSRGQTRATNIDDSTHETPRRRLRNRSVRNPPSIPRPRLTHATEEKPKSYNSEFRKRDTQRHRSSLDLSPWPSFPQLSRHQQGSPLRQLVDVWLPNTIVTSQGSKTGASLGLFSCRIIVKRGGRRKGNNTLVSRRGRPRLIQSSAQICFEIEK